MMEQDQKMMVGEMRRWQFHLGAFVAGVAQGGGLPSADAAQSSDLGSGWPLVSRTECMNEASNVPNSPPRGPPSHHNPALEGEGLSVLEAPQCDVQSPR